ncbi:hypothetical protein G7Y79_00025g056970 [Physcia stellaris]|nr:hypothetical protein G7Y79_00025g056970 [Physcia stellaris]
MRVLMDPPGIMEGLPANYKARHLFSSSNSSNGGILDRAIAYAVLCQDIQKRAEPRFRDSIVDLRPQLQRDPFLIVSFRSVEMWRVQFFEDGSRPTTVNHVDPVRSTQSMVMRDWYDEPDVLAIVDGTLCATIRNPPHPKSVCELHSWTG